MSDGPTIYVDADACPVKAEIEAVATRHKIPVVMVCNGGLRPSANPLVRMVYVEQGLDVADRWIVEAAGPADLVITADVPLAADCVAEGARVVTPDGETLTQANVGAALATRDLMTELRSANPLGTSGGGKAFGKAERARFSNTLEREVRRSLGR